mmetsp:Transcript_1485/g.3036  ORF Transcript_1485/g.3036 Transcript_1485/m.3036 type:complete len:461 (-) Transcript_1485:221-1603(-)|eukprot:CAMPEP_0181307810 /NCGR_PEP_ID=MMETSP1101-20121128/11097_1 /TAXON_ID=46948 /ORGANISM="Rhodomonas abbreviata, Strain Caron Lab Isolate" /LENGTH=460 /DNA_ID=CAMNT_0023414089 /DNA_START=109 /DNA_END=1491 /DNA_ORIENTATION=-
MPSSSSLRLGLSVRARLALLVALVVPQSVVAYQLPLSLNRFPAGGLLSASSKIGSLPKLKRSSRTFPRRLLAQVATVPQLKERLDALERSRTLGDLHTVLKNKEYTPIDDVLNGVEVGHGIRCPSLVQSIQQATTQEQRSLQKIVEKLHDSAIFSAEKPDTTYQLDLTLSEVVAAREEITREYYGGEKRMAQLSHLLANRFAQGQYECMSSVRAKTSGSEFSLSETIQPSDLAEGADSLELAARQLRNLKVTATVEGGEWQKPQMVDHSLEFESIAYNPSNVHRVSARACDYGDLWKKVADSMFQIDHPDVGACDLQTDMFNIRITVEDDESADMVREKIAKMVFSDQELRDHAVPVTPLTRSIDLISRSKNGRSLQMNWGGTKVGIDVMTLEEHYQNQELMYKERTLEQEERKETACLQLEGMSDVYRFSRKMLNWVFSSSQCMIAPPSSDKIKVAVQM